MLRKTLLAALAFALVPVMALAAPTTLDRKPLQIFNDISKKVVTYPQYTIFDDVSASIADGGVVTLTGKVTMPYKRTEIERRIEKIDGVSAVRNNIQVLPVSLFDDQLRSQIARAIYGNSMFWQYAAMANPPIHIVVANGRVTLAGVVNNEVERMMARTLATSFGAFEVKNDLKTDAEAKAALETM